MGKRFAGSEIVELGVQIEINGRDFYGYLFTKSKNIKAKEVFANLRDAEEKHIAKFREILDSVNKYDPKEAYPEEYFAHMNSMAQNIVFTQKNKAKEIAKNVRDEIEAVDLGIAAEKDSIAFYTDMKKIVPQKDIDTVDEVIEQEKDHLNHLTDLKRIYRFIKEGVVRDE
ncbi:MAG: hypothetical protein A2Z72_07840 [Omnitrophica bacterium RBG_13_46_9]|nr:MAG: hypothetical protein A2Z72_07840 [Omnitrophica bacterium RBG_13_46_9]